MKTKANGITINYQVDGPEGAPWLILSNSLATNLHMWDPQAADLSKSYRVLRYDQRGHGETDAPAGRYNFETLIADAVGLMDALGIKRAHFGGLSMGGATALGFAQQHPDRLDKVIVCDSPCQSTPASSQQWNERIAIAEKQGMEPLVEATVGRWFPAEILKANPPYLDKVRAMVRATPVNGFIGCAGALADHDYASKVADRHAAGSVPGRREGWRRRRASRHAQAERGPERVALCRTHRRRPHLQSGPAAGFHVGDPGFPGGLNAGCVTQGSRLQTCQDSYTGAEISGSG